MNLLPHHQVLELSFLEITAEESRLSARNHRALLREDRVVRLGTSRNLGSVFPGDLFVLPSQPEIVYEKTEAEPYYSQMSYSLEKIRAWPHQEYKVVKR